MLNINAEITYKYIIDNINIFFDILEYKNNNLIIKHGNLFPIVIYEEILNNKINLIEKSNDKKRVSEILCIDNLIEKEIFSKSDKIPGFDFELISISQHIIDMIKNIFKQYDDPLTKTEYEEQELLMNNYMKYFLNNIDNSKKELQEKFDGMFNMLENTREKIIRSINILKYKKQNLNEGIHKEDNKKYKFAKELQEKYITPLYYFTNDTKSLFMKNLLELRKFLDNNPKFYNQMRQLDYYLIQIPLYVKEVIPLRIYISNFIKEEEINIKRNLGSEKIFNEIFNFINENSDDNLNKKYLWSFGTTQEINKKNRFFKASGRSDKKDENIKNNFISDKTFSFYKLYVEEKILEIKNKDKQKFYENKNFELEKIKKIERMKKNKFLNNFKETFIIQIREKINNNKNINLIDFTMNFLNSEYNKWDLGYFTYLITFIIKEIKENNIKYEIIKKDDIIEIIKYERRLKINILFLKELNE